MTYHIGLLKGNPGPVWSNNHKKGTLVLQARRSIDFLSPDLWKYLGERETTKVRLKEHREEILSWVNQTFGSTFSRLIVD